MYNLLIISMTGSCGAGAVRGLGRGRLRVDDRALDEDAQDRLGPRGAAIGPSGSLRVPLANRFQFPLLTVHVRVYQWRWCTRISVLTRALCVARRATRRRAWRSWTWRPARSDRASRAPQAWPTRASTSTRPGAPAAPSLHLAHTAHSLHSPTLNDQATNLWTTRNFEPRNLWTTRNSPRLKHTSKHTVYAIKSFSLLHNHYRKQPRALPENKFL